jgi:hypothetical protein
MQRQLLPIADMPSQTFGRYVPDFGRYSHSDRIELHLSSHLIETGCSVAHVLIGEPVPTSPEHA